MTTTTTQTPGVAMVKTPWQLNFPLELGVQWSIGQDGRVRISMNHRKKKKKGFA